MRFGFGQRVREVPTGTVGTIQAINGPYYVIRVEGTAMLKTCFWSDLAWA